MESPASSHFPDALAGKQASTKTCSRGKRPHVRLLCAPAKMHFGLTLQTTGFKLLLEILARGHINSVTEVPFKFAPRRKGKSKANIMTAPPAGCDKAMRMHACYSPIEGGYVYLPTSAERLTRYLNELRGFPQGRHDDQVDSTLQTIQWVNRGKFGVP